MRCQYVVRGKGRCTRVATVRREGVLTWCGDHGQRGGLLAAREAVIKAAMAWWRAYEATDHYANAWHVLQDEHLREAFRTACAALAKLEGK